MSTTYYHSEDASASFATLRDCVQAAAAFVLIRNPMEQTHIYSVESDMRGNTTHTKLLTLRGVGYEGD